MWTKQEMCQITAELEFTFNLYVNLGIGLPTLVPNYIPQDVRVTFQSENGMLGIGPFPYEGHQDPDLINAGKETITALPESSFFSSSESFAMIRGSHIDLAILGAFEVSQNGDLANWTIPGKIMKGMGGAMDLVANVKRTVVIMEHCNKNGEAKLLKKCTLPLTGVGVVQRIITDLGVFDILGGEVTLIKKPDDVSVEEIKSKTQCDFHVNLAN